MMIGAQRLVLQACSNVPGGTDGWLSDNAIVEYTGLRLAEVRDCVESLDDHGLVRSARVTDGLKVQITAEGRIFLSQRRRFSEEDKGDQAALSPAKVVPKGLRPYDEHDAYFFLELLPGSRDRDGLPESIRFWKAPIESTDPDRTFKVGLIYGPSGSGKSSLVKAGLLPRLAEHVRSLYLGATPAGTEARLLNALRRCCPRLPADSGLAESIQALGEGHGLSGGRKLLIVLDQFEQWLSTWRGGEESDLIAALRRSDGVHVQAIVMVRDDFWMATNRFEEQLGVEFRRSQNSYGSTARGNRA